MEFELDLTTKPAGRSESGEAVVLTVGALTRRIRDLLESAVGEVWVTGEISNLRKQSSGHLYFTLKDDDAQLSCVLFARSAAALRDVEFVDGRQLEVLGELSVYEPRGQYQLIIRHARARGAGALHARFEALKKKLEAEGLFEPARKRPLPKFPSCVGLVTSPTGAAIRDFLNVLHRRHPGIEVVINPVRVQGKGAASEIARAVREFGEARRWNLPPVDVIVVTRGGGSLEDLWEFNEEEVARAVAASPIPVVSAVGHEIDFTICDFAADFRAPTPSAAAEILSADAAEVSRRLAAELTRMNRACASRMENAILQLRGLAAGNLFREPARRIDEYAQRLDRAHNGLGKITTTCLREKSQDLARWQRVFDPAALLSKAQNLKLHISAATFRLTTPAERTFAEISAKLTTLRAQLTSLSPQATLERGFTITCGPKGHPLTNARDARKLKRITTRFADGSVHSTVDPQDLLDL